MDKFAEAVRKFSRTGVYQFMERSNNAILGPIARPITKVIAWAYDRLTKR